MKTNPTNQTNSEKITTVAIIFGDNDFGNTFSNLLNTAKRILEWTPNISKENLKLILTEGIYFHYIAFQDQFKPIPKNFKTCEEYYLHLKKYLFKCKILFNDEANKAYETEDHDGGAWHLTVLTGEINYF